MKLPDTSRFLLCECSDGTPQALSPDCDTAVLCNALGLDLEAHQFVEVTFCYLARARSMSVRNGLRQRIEAATKIQHPNIASILESGTFQDETNDEDSPYFIAEFVEGERLPDFANRVKNLNRQLATSIALQISEIVAALVDHPRLLSSIELDDFAVSLDQGQFLKVRLTDFGFDRDEQPKSDMQLAIQWVKTIGIIHQRILDGRSIPVSLDEMEKTAASGHSFGMLLKRIQNQSGAQAIRTLKGLKPHVLSASGLSESALNYLDPGFRSITREEEAPIGPLQLMMIESAEFKAALADRFVPIMERERFGFSPFRKSARFKSRDAEEFEKDSVKAKEARVSLTILPPERFLNNCGTQALNKKMSDSYLKKHPSSMRTRSLLCESNYTLVVSERLTGVSLPTLIAQRGSLAPMDSFELIIQIDRALTHFESSDFGFHSFSPWQVDLHFENIAPEELKKCITRAPISNWPAWDVKLRVEKPAESYLESRHSPWRYLHNRMDHKSFPALALWLTECDRFEWALTIGNEDREPLSWNPSVNKLMDSTIQFFDASEPKHRKRMIDLLYEIHEKEVRPEPETILSRPELPMITINDPEVLLPLPAGD